MKRLLLHTCCAVCAYYPYKKLTELGYEVFLYWYNPNIHGYREYKKRYEAFKKFAEDNNIKTIVSKNYDFEQFLRDVAFRENTRCQICYYKRLEATAKVALSSKFDGFSSTLLVSLRQKHDIIKDIGISLAKKIGIQFVYHDFREGAKCGYENAVENEYYKQEFCGCIYSEMERYTMDALKSGLIKKKR